MISDKPKIPNDSPQSLLTIYSAAKGIFQKKATAMFLVPQNIFRSLSFPHQEVESVFPPLDSG